jgi:hypothetical protein
VAPASEWPQIYPTVDRSRVKFRTVLTGYLDDRKLAWLSRLGREAGERPIDIGYRTSGKPYYWFGRHGFLKESIAELFLEHAPSRGMRLDISTRDEDAIPGDEWYRFLSRCRYTIGAEGGTSIVDFDGSIRRRTEAHLRRQPDASFAEVEAACFPGRDGSAALYALSPRHLEACATRTCQVLTLGHYNGILEPGRHYIGLEKDFSNIQEVLDAMGREDLRRQMAERAYRDIAASNRYTYSRFAEFVVREALESAPPPRAHSPLLAAWCGILHRWMWAVERAEWARIRLAHTAGGRILARARAWLRRAARSLACVAAGSGGTGGRVA